MRKLMMNHIIEVCHNLFFRQTSFYVRFQLAWSKKNISRNAMWNPDKLSGDHVPLANLLKFPIHHPYVLRSSHIFSQFHLIFFRFSMSLDLPSFCFCFSINCPSFYIVRADSPSCSGDFHHCRRWRRRPSSRGRGPRVKRRRNRRRHCWWRCNRPWMLHRHGGLLVWRIMDKIPQKSGTSEIPW